VTQKKFLVSVLIWGAIDVGDKSGCFFCFNAVDTGEYQSLMIHSRLVEDMNERCGPHAWYFMQKGASVHTAKSTTDYLQSVRLVLPGWPPNSPDLNPIEMIWALLKVRVKVHHPQTKEELQEMITRAWDELDQDLLDKIVSSFGKRVQLLIKARG
jgi:transposase